MYVGYKKIPSHLTLPEMWFGAKNAPPMLDLRTHPLAREGKDGFHSCYNVKERYFNEFCEHNTVGSHNFRLHKSMPCTLSSPDRATCNLVLTWHSCEMPTFCLPWTGCSSWGESSGQYPPPPPPTQWPPQLHQFLLSSKLNIHCVHCSKITTLFPLNLIDWLTCVFHISGLVWNLFLSLLSAS